jgi:hypothetical protein
LAAVFLFPKKMALVFFFYVTEEIINGIGAPKQGNLDDFLLAIKKGPPWITRHRQSICQQALQ